MTKIGLEKENSVHSTPVRVLAIAGSLRTRSWNLRLLEAAVTCAPAGLQIEIFQDLAAIPMFNEDLETAGMPQVIHHLRERVGSADGLLIATPEYNQSVPGVIKNLIDWLSRASLDRPDTAHLLTEKPIAVIGASSGRWGTRLAQYALRQTLFATESLVMPSPTLYVRDAPTLFDANGTLSDAALRASLQTVLESFTNWINLIRRDAQRS
jgi:chromate reductase, NAD(P)H dehydrogenase (quinone)